MNYRDDEFAPANMTDAELDNWLSAVNDDMCETLDYVVDTQRDLLRLKQQVAQEAMAVAQQTAEPARLDQVIREVLHTETTAPEAARRVNAPGRPGPSRSATLRGKLALLPPLIRYSLPPVMLLAMLPLLIAAASLWQAHGGHGAKHLIAGVGVGSSAVVMLDFVRSCLRRRSNRVLKDFAMKSVSAGLRAAVMEQYEQAELRAECEKVRTLWARKSGSEVRMHDVLTQLWKARCQQNTALSEKVVRNVASMLSTAPVVFVKDNPSRSLLLRDPDPDRDRGEAQDRDGQPDSVVSTPRRPLPDLPRSSLLATVGRGADRPVRRHGRKAPPNISTPGNLRT